MTQVQLIPSAPWLGYGIIAQPLRLYVYDQLIDIPTIGSHIKVIGYPCPSPCPSASPSAPRHVASIHVNNVQRVTHIDRIHTLCSLPCFVDLVSSSCQCTQRERCHELQAAARDGERMMSELLEGLFPTHHWHNLGVALLQCAVSNLDAALSEATGARKQLNVLIRHQHPLVTCTLRDVIHQLKGTIYGMHTALTPTVSTDGMMDLGPCTIGLPGPILVPHLECLKKKDIAMLAALARSEGPVARSLVLMTGAPSPEDMDGCLVKEIDLWFSLSDDMPLTVQQYYEWTLQHAAPCLNAHARHHVRHAITRHAHALPFHPAATALLKTYFLVGRKMQAAVTPVWTLPSVTRIAEAHAVGRSSWPLGDEGSACVSRTR